MFIILHPRTFVNRFITILESHFRSFFKIHVWRKMRKIEESARPEPREDSDWALLGCAS